MKKCLMNLPPAYSPAVLADACKFCNIADDYQHLSAVAEKIASDHSLAEYACNLYKEFTEGVGSFANYYRPVDKLGEDADHIFLLTVLSAMPETLVRYRSQGTPEDIIAATLDLSNKSGKREPVKLLPRQVAYCRRYYKGAIFRLGRFHFTISEDKRDLPAVVINRQDPSRKILLSADQMFYDDNGFVDNQNPTWLTRASLTEKTISGNLINSNGTASKERRTYAADQWTWRYGARTVIDMHIPAGGGMTPDLSRESLKKAFSFFMGKSSVVYCNSWIFNPQLQGLPGTDNMTALMKMGHLFPVKSSSKEGMFFLYGTETDDLSTLPTHTTLQRSALEFMQAGGQLRAGGIFFFADEIC